eukprot:scaffold151842_cov30-Tisochrysis_lutea.AAC.2
MKGGESPVCPPKCGCSCRIHVAAQTARGLGAYHMTESFYSVFAVGLMRRNLKFPCKLTFLLVLVV